MYSPSAGTRRRRICTNHNFYFTMYTNHERYTIGLAHAHSRERMPAPPQTPGPTPTVDCTPTRPSRRRSPNQNCSPFPSPWTAVGSATHRGTVLRVAAPGLAPPPAVAHAHDGCLRVGSSIGSTVGSAAGSAADSAAGTAAGSAAGSGLKVRRLLGNE